MKRNFFDNSGFLAAYLRFRARDIGFNSALERPAMCDLLPRLSGLRILDLGCGSGEFCRLMAVRGASRVVGVDCSAKMIGLAQSAQAGLPEKVDYRRAYIEECRFPSDGFDLIVSSMTFHYIEDIGMTFQKISKWLKSGGTFVFSVEHPIFTAGRLSRNGTGAFNKKWQVARYFEEGERRLDWLGYRVLKYHRKMDTILNKLIAAQFTVLRMVEPSVALSRLRRGVTIEKNRPAFLLIKAQRAAKRV